MALINNAGTTPVGFIAGGTITIGQAVKLDSTAGQVVETSAITSVVIGFAAHSATSGQNIAIYTVSGSVVKAIASAAIALGARLMPNASGQVTTAAGATAFDCGVALEAAGAAGDIISILFHPTGMSPVNS